MQHAQYGRFETTASVLNVEGVDVRPLQTEQLRGALATKRQRHAIARSGTERGTMGQRERPLKQLEIRHQPFRDACEEASPRAGDPGESRFVVTARA